ncbi:MAG: aminotransferase class V-fold PLP-dependent enzyme [Promethearchaeota archaeon]|nr:MAG: aminotransferase class V-fold PLP-dependent enzyme [Candidatus Lokiarchaeota archaeon]
MNYPLNMENSDKEVSSAFNVLDKIVHDSLETYSNVHRGTGHNSQVTTALYEKARELILDYLQLSKKKFNVIFCSPLRLDLFKTQLNQTDYRILSSKAFGLPLGVKAIAVKKKKLKKCSVIYTGGGMIKHVTSNYVIWADIPDRFEAGTPNIINVIVFTAAIHSFKNLNTIFKRRLNHWSLSSKEILFHDDFTKFSGLELLTKLQKSLIGYKIKVPTNGGRNKFINLDNAASTPSFLPIWNTYCKTLRQPEEMYQEIINNVKIIIAKFFNTPLEKYDIIFTSNTTESINILARNFTKFVRKDLKSVIVNTMLEHHSNELPFRYVPSAKLIRVSVDDKGFIDLHELEQVLCEYNKDHKHNNEKIELVSVSGVSNVIGTYNDLRSISHIVHKYNAKLLVDGAQIVAHHKIDFSRINIDYFAFSGHKIYAPFGSGVLIIKKELMELDKNEIIKIKSSGEENVVGIATLGKAILLLGRIGMEVIEDYEGRLTKLALDGLNKIKNLEIFGIKDSRAMNVKNRGAIISFNLKTVPHNLAAKELAEQGGIGIRNGCFCAHMLVQHILKIQKIRIIGARMTSIIIPKKTEMCLPGTLRVSFGIENNETDVYHLLNTIEKLNYKHRSILDKLLGLSNNGTLFLPRTVTEEKIRYFIKNRLNLVFSVDK